MMRCEGFMPDCGDDRMYRCSVVVDRTRKAAHIKALVYHSYVSPDALVLRNSDKPKNKDSEVLL